MAGEVHVSDTPIHRMTIHDQDDDVVDVSGATLKTIVFEKPDGTIVTQTATFFTNGTDGIVEYQTVGGDHDFAGPWRKQAHVTIASGNWTSTIVSFPVAAKL